MVVTGIKAANGDGTLTIPLENGTNFKSVMAFSPSSTQYSYAINIIKVGGALYAIGVGNTLGSKLTANIINNELEISGLQINNGI